MSKAQETEAAQSSTAKLFWFRLQKEAALIAYTPFVVCLAAGTLEIESLRQCISQDVHFLRAFAQAYEMVEGSADDDDKEAIRDARIDVLKKLRKHSSFLQEWGIDPTKEVVSSTTTAKYINFLLTIADGDVGGIRKNETPFERTKIAAYTVGAMTPCTRLYHLLGRELQMFVHHDENDHPFKKWIDTYSSKSFEAAVFKIEDLLDKLSVSLTGDELEIIEKLYCQAIKLERDFFSAQPVVRPAVVPLIRLHDPKNHLVIFSDFDITCTTVDSSAIFAEIAIGKAPKTDLSDTELSGRKSSSDMRKSWDAFSSQYTKEYEQCVKSLLLGETAKSFNYEGLYKGLEQLSEFEKRANSRIIESGMLSGISLNDIKRAGDNMVFQCGCVDFFDMVVWRKEELNADLHIVSYCWCADIIRSAFASGCLDDLTIHSNEFSYENCVSTGEIIRKMESPIDKLEAFKGVLRNHSENGQNLSVYIGDTVGDFLCLLQADVGIVIGTSSSLRVLGKHFGFSFIPLFPGLVNKQRQYAGPDSCIWKGLSGVLYTVSSWSEIQAFLLGF